MSHRRIRRVSLDQFYAVVTGEQEAFYQMCLVLPDVINDVVASGKNIKAPTDTVIDELRSIAGKTTMPSEELSMAMAIYLLGFNTYKGFRKGDEMIDRLYEYHTKMK